MTRHPTSSARSLALNPLALACLMTIAAASGSVRAEQAGDMQDRLDSLQKQIADLQAQMSAMAERPEKPADKAATPSGVQLKAAPARRQRRPRGR